MKKLSFHLFRWIIIMAVFIVAGIGLYIAGSPGQERARKFDEQRVRDIEQQRGTIDQFYTRQQRLPKDLQELTSSPESSFRAVLDPRRQTPYEYRPIATSTHELCATFETDQSKTPLSPYYQNEILSKHQSGRRCYTFDILSSTPSPVQMYDHPLQKPLY